MAITYKNDANPLTSAKLIKAALAKIQLPPTLHAKVLVDSSIYINASLKEIVETFVITIILVMLIVIVFLASFRMSLIPMITIPISLCGTFIIMYSLGFSINLLTMLAFVLAIGLVVDDAIVVMENIHRHIMMGKTPFQAAVIGIKELVTAIIGITITLLVVFSPVALSDGVTGALFKQFAFTLAGSVLVSGIAALLLTPMMCSKIISTKESPITVKVEHFFDRLSQNYKRGLNIIIDKKFAVILTVVAVMALGGTSGYLLSKTSILAPTEDQGTIMGIAMGPTSASLPYTENNTRQIPPMLKKYQSDINGFNMINGWPKGQYMAIFFIKLNNWDVRNASADEIQNYLSQKVQSVPGMSVMLTQPPPLPTSKGIYSFEFEIKTMGGYSELNSVLDKILQESKNNPNILSIQTDLHIDQPQIVVQIDRKRANYLGITMDNISTALSNAFAQPHYNQFELAGYSYYVIPQINDQDRANEGIIDLLTIKTATGKVIPLSTVVTLKNEMTAISWPHFQGQRSAKIAAQLAPNYSVQQALTYFEGLFNKYKTSSMQYDTSGQTRTYLETQSGVIFLFLAALVMIFFVLSAQYESFLDPLVIMITVPLAISGALLALYFSGYSLNIYTELGLITLIGLISKHGILLVDFARQYKAAHGSSTKESIIEAASIRLKPVLMTTFAMVFGSVPLLFASSAGAHSRNQIGMVIVAGMTIGTIFTLIVLPTLYCIIRRDKPSKTTQQEINI